MTNKQLHRNAFYERSHMFMPGNHVVLAFHIQGILPEDHVREAIEKMRIKHLLIGAHMEVDEQNNAWFEVEDTPPIELIVIKQETDKPWLDVLYENYWKRFEIRKGPLIRFLLI